MRPLDLTRRYIPRFVLRQFQEPSGGTTESRVQYDLGPAHREDTFRCYSSSSGEYDPSRQIVRTYGPLSLYRDAMDIPKKKLKHLERKLERLENEVARLTQSIQADIDDGKPHLAISRKDYHILRKFLFLIYYIDPSCFKEDDPQHATIRNWAREQKKAHHLLSDAHVWLHCLEYYLSTPHHQILRDVPSPGAYGDPAAHQLWTVVPHVGQDIKSWYAQYYAMFNLKNDLQFCSAPSDTEYLLDHNLIGLWEDSVRLCVVSPQLAVTLRTADNHQGLAHGTILRDLPVIQPKIEYATTGHSLTPEVLEQHLRSPASQQDLFIYQVQKLTPDQLWSVNKAILGRMGGSGTLTFKSEVFMYRMLERYDTSRSIFGLTARMFRFWPLKTILSQRVQSSLQFETPPPTESGATSQSPPSSDEVEGVRRLPGAKTIRRTASSSSTNSAASTTSILSPDKTEEELSEDDQLDALPSTVADIEFRRKLQSLEKRKGLLDYCYGRDLYLAAIMSKEMNDPIALKIRCLVSDATDAFSTSNNISQFSQYITLSNDLEVIFSQSECEVLYSNVNEVARKYLEKIAINNPAQIYPALVYGFLIWYVKNDVPGLVGCCSSHDGKSGSLEDAKLAKKLRASFRPTALCRHRAYQVIQISWCMWKLARTGAELYPLVLLCILMVYERISFKIFLFLQFLQLCAFFAFA